MKNVAVAVRDPSKRVWVGLILATLSCAPEPAGPPWREIDGNGPPPRWGHVQVADAFGGAVYVFGGTQSGMGLGELLDDLWRFDIVDEQWERLEPEGERPTARMTSAAIFDEQRRRMVLMGGTTGEPSDEVWAFDVDEQRWSRLPSGPSPRFDVNATTDGRLAWVAGGFRSTLSQVPGAALAEVWELDLTRDTWRQLPSGGNAPAPRTNAVFGVLDGALWWSGGHDEWRGLDDTWRYDLAGSRWQRVDVDGALSATTHQAVALDVECGALLSFGGDNVDTCDVADTDRFVVDGGRPRRAPLAVTLNPPARRHAGLAFLPDRSLLLFGGWAGQGSVLGDTLVLEEVPCGDR